jgi:dihydroorotate dehydrogenase (fumarate)
MPMTIDLTTNYGGLNLTTPIVVGACPLTADERVRASIESAGAGAIVLPSLFDEQVVVWNKSSDKRHSERSESEPSTKMPDPIWQSGEAYLSFVNRASTLSSIPIIASLNGHNADQWIDFADELEEAGAAGIELNIHHGPASQFRDSREIESLVVHAVSEINASVTIPIFVKLSNEYTSISHLARELQSGIQGLVLFGRRPNVDIDLDQIQLKTQWGLTSAGSVAHSLETIMQVHGCCPSIPIAANGGIGSSEDVVKALLAGADVAMVTSAIYRDGVEVIGSFIDGLTKFLEAHQMQSIRELQTARPLQFASEEERSSYIKALSARLDSERVTG